MKRILTAIIISICFAFTVKAQYVNIPDSMFQYFLTAKYPACIDSVGRVDTTCNEIINEDSLSLELNGYDLYAIKSIEGIQYFKKLQFFSCTGTSIHILPKLSDSIKTMDCSQTFDTFRVESSLPKNLEYFDCSNNIILKLPELPSKLKYFNCSRNFTFIIATIDSLPKLPNSLQVLKCYNQKIKFLNPLPDSLTYLDCANNKLLELPNLPQSLLTLACSGNNLTNLPVLPESLQVIDCYSNQIYCLPKLPSTLTWLNMDSNIKCLPNFVPGIASMYPNIPICNPVNNSNHCQSFAVAKSVAYTDLNSNNKLDVNEFPKHNLKLTLSNNNYYFTNSNGEVFIAADSLGTYTITATAPNFYNVVPASYTHNFSSYDTLVIDTFALQPTVLKDSISIKLTPTNWAARTGRSYPYLVSYENVGTTVLSTPIINFNYDSSLLVYDSSSVTGVTNNGNNLSLNIGNIVPGQTGSFIAYFTVKTTAVLGSTVTSATSINAGSVNATDSVTTIVRGSYDPNDKQATPNLTVAEVADNNHWIDYNIRFQNTGTDTAFNVVIADTLSPLVQWDQLQFKGSSHLCRTTVKGNVIFFEFIDIYLPDSNTNKTGSNGFVNFAVKPLTTLTNGTLVPNTASIYFDYNSPVVTNTAHTLIGSILPLTLVSFNAIPKEDENKIFVYWNTANEVNTSHFVIEQSVDGRTFKPAVEIAAKGSGSNSYFYSITKSNTVYLRLKMVDKNGAFTYSNIIKLTEDKTNGFDIVNNPAKGSLNVNVRSTSLNNTTAKIVNVQGQIVKTFMLKHNLQTIDIAALQRGVYYLQTNLGAKKFVVE